MDDIPCTYRCGEYFSNWRQRNRHVMECPLRPRVTAEYRTEREIRRKKKVAAQVAKEKASKEKAAKKQAPKKKDLETAVKSSDTFHEKCRCGGYLVLFEVIEDGSRRTYCLGCGAYTPPLSAV